MILILKKRAKEKANAGAQSGEKQILYLQKH
jgi:hypothetical protein